MDVTIIGGGLAGLIAGLELTRAGLTVTLIERKTYPFHKVCGEYVSNEVRPYLESLGLPLTGMGATRIDRFQFTAPSGRSLETALDLGGFGISRFRLDHALYELGKREGITFLLNRQAERCTFSGDSFSVTLNTGEVIRSRLVIGAFGKRSKLDKQLDRRFMRRPSPYIGVKYHIRPAENRPEFRADTVALHNFQDGYCGLSSIEDGNYCLCYLTTRAQLRRFGSVPELEKAVLQRNPYLKAIYGHSELLYEKPEVINEVSFAPKQAVEDHILMAGDSAGLITPLCGNGMAMAIRGGWLAADLASGFLKGRLTRAELERRYRSAWSDQFDGRLRVGRITQRLFGDEWLSGAAVSLFGAVPPLLRGVIRRTHGEPFNDWRTPAKDLISG
ncbi:NAD(P)/FAD-dependent oxidoreductase [Larkinella soli]|uniref:NAD(P)/FAD-dependent oxidoreductase n=1 Tax=Larkinella soli TaxID=1770527 RepID=UPI000FFC18A6|nr:FAD-dependent oxidoreductase [Larkinella soli]